MVLDWPTGPGWLQGFGGRFSDAKIEKMGEIFDRRMNPNLFHVANGKILHID